MLQCSQVVCYSTGWCILETLIMRHMNATGLHTAGEGVCICTGIHQSASKNSRAVHTILASSSGQLQDSLCRAGTGPSLPKCCPQCLPVKCPVQDNIHVPHLIAARELCSTRHQHCSCNLLHAGACLVATWAVAASALSHWTAGLCLPLSNPAVKCGQKATGRKRALPCRPLTFEFFAKVQIRHST